MIVVMKKKKKIRVTQIATKKQKMIDKTKWIKVTIMN